MFGRRQRDDERDGARWDQADGRSDDFVDPWAEQQDHDRPVSGDGYWYEPDDPAGNSGSNGQWRAGGQGPGSQGPGGPTLNGATLNGATLNGPTLNGPTLNGQGYGDSPRGEPRPVHPDPEDGPFGRRHAYNDQRDSFRDNPRDGLRDNPRDGLADYSRDGLRDNPRDGLADYSRDGLRDNPRDGLADHSRDGLRENGGPAGRHSSVRPDWRERDAGPWGQPEPEMPVPEFIPAVIAPPVPPGGVATSRPFGRLLIFTLREDRAAEFDRLAEQAAEGVRTEPDTLVYVFHTAPTEPMQRIIYEIYRDRAAFESHQRQPHIQRFTDEVKSCVLGSNVIDLRLKYAKVAPLQGVSQPGGGQPAAAPSGPPQPYGGRADAEPTARHRAPRSLETASRSLGEERYDSRPGEQTGPAGGGRRAESADDWPPARDWGRS
ncbi:MAG: hypothetical protein JWM19_5461 [Actinomycetia bacterium]|nr:hypothetical protein [Actinomycetes bacterium]